ncbi:MAG: hypothetical protein WB626_00445 [Bacteroidota bacterium]
MQKHVTAVAALQIGLGALGVMIGLAVFFLLGMIGTFSGDSDAMVILPALGTALGGTLALLSLLAVIGGIGLLKYRNWARILILVLSVFDLFNIPIGTAVAIYSFWVLVQDETARLFTVTPSLPEPGPPIAAP